MTDSRLIQLEKENSDLKGLILQVLYAKASRDQQVNLMTALRLFPEFADLGMRSDLEFDAYGKSGVTFYNLVIKGENVNATSDLQESGNSVSTEVGES